MGGLQWGGDWQQHKHCFLPKENKLQSEVSASEVSLMQTLLSVYALQCIKSCHEEEMPGNEQ